MGRIKQQTQEKGDLFKYIRVGDEFRFCMVVEGEEHSEMLKPGEKADSGGAIITTKDCFAFLYYGSDSCDCDTDPDDLRLLEEKLELEYKVEQ